MVVSFVLDARGKDLIDRIIIELIEYNYPSFKYVSLNERDTNLEDYTLILNREADLLESQKV